MQTTTDTPNTRGNLKITQADFDALAGAVAPLDTPERRAAYLRGDFPRADVCGDRDKRYRWDLVHASGFRVVDLYGYLSDPHIDSALRRIVRPLDD